MVNSIVNEHLCGLLEAADCSPCQADGIAAWILAICGKPLMHGPIWWCHLCTRNTAVSVCRVCQRPGCTRCLTHNTRCVYCCPTSFLGGQRTPPVSTAAVSTRTPELSSRSTSHTETDEFNSDVESYYQPYLTDE
jgi:hypothetical protein